MPLLSKFSKENDVPSGKRTRAPPYQPEKQCVICGDLILPGLLSPPKTGGVVPIGSLQARASLQVSATRRKDSWGDEVTCRLKTVLDDKTVMKIRYQRNCYKTFIILNRFLPGRSPQLPVCTTPSVESSPSPPPAQRPRLSPGLPRTTPVRAKNPRLPSTSTSAGARALAAAAAAATAVAAVTAAAVAVRAAEVASASTPLRQLQSSSSFNVRGGRGRPIDVSKQDAFEKLCIYLDSNERNQHDMNSLIAKMEEINPSSQYTEKTLRSKLQEKYGSKIVFSSTHRSKTVVTFCGRMSEILSVAHRTSTDATKEKQDLDAAAKIILRDITAMRSNKDQYPTVAEIEGGKNIVPDSLKQLLESIIGARKRGKAKNWERKCVAIANNIIAATRPHSFLSPLQLGLTVHIHRNHASKELVNILHSLGTYCSYSEAQKYEDTIVFTAPPSIAPGSFMQFSFDNVDYNGRTLDGLGTWHCMGGIRCVTPSSGVGCDIRLARSAAAYTSKSRAAFGTIPLRNGKYVRSRGLKSITVPDYSMENIGGVSAELKFARNMDYLWLLGTIFHTYGEPTPGWNGYMEVLTKGKLYDKTAVLPLPFVNLNPNNPMAIYTCLDFAVQEALNHGHSYCFVTFDQPMFWKAVDIVSQAEDGSHLKRVYVRLGGFHLLLSYLGCIGHIMAGSGLESLWEMVYAQHTVPHMMGGRAYSRAMRAHFLTQLVVVRLFLDTFGSNFTSLALDKADISRVFKERMEQPDSEELVQSVDKFLADMDKLPREVEIGRTGKLWLQYVRMVEYIHHFVRAERSGSWDLHVAAVKMMLPAFPAAGHLNYAKSVPLYLQIMSSIQGTLTEKEYQDFVTKGYFAIRRSDKFFSGIWSDLTIEQVLMASIKDQRGVTRGRGMKDATIATFVHTMPLCSRVSRAVKAFAGLSTDGPEQHVDLRGSRMRRDRSDSGKLFEWFRAHSPFSKPADQIVSISTGLVGDASVNCDSAFEVGTEILKKMAGKNFGELTLKRKDRALPLAAMNSSIKIGDAVVPISVDQLFHRIVFLNLPDKELADCFHFELAPYPTSLFDGISTRKGTKSAFMKALDQLCPPDETVPSKPFFVYDGGHLLHHVIWPRPATFGEIAALYTNHVLSIAARYEGSIAVVFDGYSDEPSTKDTEHVRRSVRTSADIVFDQSTATTVSQALFLTNGSNKDRLIQFVAARLRAAGVEVLQSEGDADREIVTLAIAKASNGGDSVMIGADTDLLVLMIALTPRNLQLHFMTSSQARGVVVRHSKPLQTALAESVDHVLMVHAMMGCDTTSYPYNRSKKKALAKLKTTPALHRAVAVFNNPNSTLDEVGAAGENFLLHVYCKPRSPNLNKARHELYKAAIARQPVTSRFQIATLPPTSAAARFHSARAYFQVQAWKGNHLDASEWGWRVARNMLVPVQTSIAPAPDRLLRIVTCNCRGSCASCTCSNAGLPCSNMCGFCAGVSCENPAPIEETPGEEESDADDPEETQMETDGN